MPDARRETVACASPTGSHLLSYRVWGEPEPDRTVVCVHGLTGNAHDFDDLAAALEREGHHVVCPDLPGRGASDWLTDADQYGLRQYVADLTRLLERMDTDAVDWVGTSLGGLIGMTIAARPGAPLRRLVINDIGPFVPTAALQRLATYLGTDPTFAGVDEAERWLRDVRAPFGPLADAQWRRMTEHAVRPRGGGGFRLHYDPRIAEPYARTVGHDLELWPTWDAITCPVLVLRGERSDLLLADTAREMATCGPKAEVVEIAGCGHAPALLDPAQIALVTRWLGAPPHDVAAPGTPR